MVGAACVCMCFFGAVFAAVEAPAGAATGPESTGKPAKTPDVPPPPAAPKSPDSKALAVKPTKPEVAKPKPAPKPASPGNAEGNGAAAQDEAAVEKAEIEAAQKKPVGRDPVQVFGYIEWVKIGQLAGRMRARLDTGARTSSLHVESQEEFERDGAKWVRFVVPDSGKSNAKRARIVAPLVRWTRIKNPGGGYVRRRVVRLNLEIGGRKLRTEFSLTNRNNMLCPVLVGRRALRDLGLVDACRIDLADKKIFR